MSIPTTSTGIPLRTTTTPGTSGTAAPNGPSRPGTRPANSPAPARANQNAFAQALARAQAQNVAFRGSMANPPGLGVNGLGLPGLPGATGTGDPTGLGDPTSMLQALSMNQNGDQSGLPLNLQALMQQAAASSSAVGNARAVTPSVPAAPAQNTLQVPGGFGPLVQEAAQKYGVDPALIAAVMETESKFNPDAVSRAGAKGLMQLMPATARGLGVTDPSDPKQAILGGAKLLGILMEKYGGKLDLAIAAYNAGSGAVDKAGGIPPFGETQQYVPLVLSAYERYKAQLGTGGQPS